MPLRSPSGRFLLDTPVEAIGAEPGSANARYQWRIIISDPAGKPIYEDHESQVPASQLLRWAWDKDDRLWVLNVQERHVHWYQESQGEWRRQLWGVAGVKRTREPVEPPPELTVVPPAR